MERKIFINWRWTVSNNEVQDNKFRELPIEENNKSVVFSWFWKNDELDNETDNLKALISRTKSDDNLILLHRDNGILPPDLDGLSYHIEDFGGGYDFVYFPNGFIITDINCVDDLITSLKNLNLKEIFESVWKEYTENLPLEEQKKNLINLFLPLAIDIQGLSEINDEGKEREYLNDITKEYNHHERSIIDDYLEIKKILTDKKTEIPDPRFLNEKYKQDGLIIFIKDNYKVYRSNPEDKSALPVWLKDVVAILDDKINKHKKPSDAQ